VERDKRKKEMRNNGIKTASSHSDAGTYQLSADLFPLQTISVGKIQQTGVNSHSNF